VPQDEPADRDDSQKRNPMNPMYHWRNQYMISVSPDIHNRLPVGATTIEIQSSEQAKRGSHNTTFEGLCVRMQERKLARGFKDWTTS
jgi:hypothetical protein